LLTRTYGVEKKIPRNLKKLIFGEKQIVLEAMKSDRKKKYITE
jgi:hypothetical protein